MAISAASYDQRSGKDTYTHYACGQIHTETSCAIGGHTVTTTYTYDDNARPATMTVTSTDPADAAPLNPGDGSFVKYTTYDADGFLLAESDLLGGSRKHWWLHAYDNKGNRTVTTGPLDANFSQIADETGTETWTYNADDQLSEHVDVSGAKWTYDYDARRRLYEAHKPHPTQTGMTVLDYRIAARDEAGNVTMREDALSNMQRSYYGFATAWAAAANLPGKFAGMVQKTYLPGDSEIQNDFLNYATEYNYGSSFLGRDTTVKDARGNETHTALDAQFRVTVVTYPDATTDSYEYDDNGNRVTHTDRNGDTRYWHYDERNRADIYTAADDGTTEYEYDLDGRTAKTTTQIDDTQDLVSETVYSRLGRTTEQIVNGVTKATWEDFDEESRPATSTFAAYNENNPTGSPTYTVTTNSYWERGLLKERVTDPTGLAIVEKWEYDLAGRQTKYTDGRENDSTTAYTNAGLVASQTNGNDETVSYGYDDLYRAVSVTNARNFTTYTQYHDNGWVEKVTRPNGDYVFYSHDSVGNVVSEEVFDEEKDSYAKTVYTYNNVNRVETKTALLKNQQDEYLTSGVKEAYAYDGMGRRTAETRDPEGLNLTTSFTYDSEGRLTRTTRPDGKHSDSTYDYAGNRLTFADEKPRTTSYVYDNESRLIRVEAPAQAPVDYVYDSAGNLLGIEVDDDSTRVTDYTYDQLNRRTSETFPQGYNDERNVRYYSYDATHNVSTYRDGRDVLTVFGRDGAGRVVSKVYEVPENRPEIREVPDVGYAYDANGNLTGISNSDGAASWEYDSLDRLETEQVGNGPQITYVYDPRGVILSETVTGQSKLSTDHEYDAVGRRIKTTQDDQETEFVWDNALRRTKVTLPGGDYTVYAHDNVDRPEHIYYRKADDTLFEHYAYTYDDVGNPTALETMNGDYSYGYDTAYRLTSESRTGFKPYSIAHVYDSMGNRTQRTTNNVVRTFSYNKADQITGWTETATDRTAEYVYDSDGNTIQKLVYEDEALIDQWDYEFDSVGRMNTGTQSEGGTQSIVNVYAGDQWYRVSENLNGTTRKYGWRRDELFAEFNSSDELTAGYLNDGVDRPLFKTRFEDDGETVAARDFYHQDANLRVHHVTDTDGDVAEKYVYTGYGERKIMDSADNDLSASAIGNRIGFQGREHEDLSGPGQEHGLTFHRNRFYDPDTGRWERRDPLFIQLRFKDYQNRAFSQITPIGSEMIVYNKLYASLYISGDTDYVGSNMYIGHSNNSFRYTDMLGLADKDNVNKINSQWNYNLCWNLCAAITIDVTVGGIKPSAGNALNSEANRFLVPGWEKYPRDAGGFKQCVADNCKKLSSLPKPPVIAPILLSSGFWYGRVCNRSTTSVAVSYGGKPRNTWLWCRLFPCFCTNTSIMDADGWCDVQGRCYKVSDWNTGVDYGFSFKGATFVPSPVWSPANPNGFNTAPPPTPLTSLPLCPGQY